MASPRIYHYRKGLKVPKMQEFMKDMSWLHRGLHILVGFPIEEIHGETYPEYRKRYCDLQNSDAPEWKKIAAVFLTDYALVLDEDRDKASYALKMASEELLATNNDHIANGLKKIAGLIRRLSEGPIVFTTDYPIYNEPEKNILFADKIDREKLIKKLSRLKRDETAENMDYILESCQYQEWTPIEELQKVIPRVTQVPYLWPCV
jgi:hypothetical protein